MKVLKLQKNDKLGLKSFCLGVFLPKGCYCGAPLCLLLVSCHHLLLQLKESFAPFETMATRLTIPMKSLPRHYWCLFTPRHKELVASMLTDIKRLLFMILTRNLCTLCSGLVMQLAWQLCQISSITTKYPHIYIRISGGYKIVCVRRWVMECLYFITL